MEHLKAVNGEVDLAIVEARLEGRSVVEICNLTGKSGNYVRKVLKKPENQVKLDENRELFEQNLNDIKHREVVMRERATEIVLDALNGQFGVDKQFDAGKVVYKTQKFESGVRDATAAFRELFLSKASD